MFYQIEPYLQCIIVLVLSILISCFLTKGLIHLQNNRHFFQPQREELSVLHQTKQKTPSMGGIAICLSSYISLLIVNYQVFFDKKVLDVLLTFLGFFLVGLVDDLLKMIAKNYHGMKESLRLFIEIILAFLLLKCLGFSYTDFQYINLFDNHIYLGIGAILLCTFVLVGSSNAMNLSDGLDGLATCLFIISLMPFTIYAFKQKEVILGLFLVASFGSSIGFVIFNMHPSKIFMGDSGSLFLGSILGGVAIYFHLEYVLMVAGFVLIIETISVILQVFYYKLTKKRIFLMAPLHHHFEMKGFSEERVVLIFMVIGYFCSFLAMLMIL